MSTPKPKTATPRPFKPDFSLNELDWERVETAVAAHIETLSPVDQGAWSFTLMKVRERMPADCNCTAVHTAFAGNPHGHAVDCPRWGSKLPNKAAG